MALDLRRSLERAGRDLESAVELFLNSPSVQARLEGTGLVSLQATEDLGFLGVTARATGSPRDTRADHPWGWYAHSMLPVSSYPTGDVHARARVRWMEAQRSIQFIQTLLGHLPKSETRVQVPSPKPRQLTVAMTEGWRGEIVHVAITDQAGRFQRYKIVDPSFRNWTALAIALRDQQISDFPLCNKSFNLSYCGFDL